MNFWDNWTKPWTREQCRDRYVRGSAISIKQLAKLSEVALGTLNHWRKGDAGKTWAIQRGEFWVQQQSQADQNVMLRRSHEQASLESVHQQAQAEMIQELKISLKELGLEHYEAYRSVRRVAAFMLDQYEGMVRQLTDPKAIAEDVHPEQAEEIKKKRLEFQMDPAKFIKAINLNSLGAIAQIIDLCVRGERTATGMEYEDINKAIRLIKRAGLEVSVPDNTDLVRVKTQ